MPATTEDWFEQHRDGVLVRLYIQPSAAATEVVGLHNQRLKIRVAAPPEKGKANRELQKFLSRRLNVSKQDVFLLRGETSREKDMIIASPSSPAVARQLLQ